MISYIRDGFRSWFDFVRFIAYFFSIKILLKTLFSGWHRDSTLGREWWERLILSFIIITIGIAIRLSIITLGLFFIICSIVFLPFMIVLPIRPSYKNLVKIGAIGKSWSYGGSPTLHHYGKILYRGADKKLYGRDETIDMMTRILSREEKDNVLLVGTPGSGRETIVAQFAKSVYRGMVPEKIRDREVIELLLSDMTESTLAKAFDEALTAGNIILVLQNPEKYKGVLGALIPLLLAPELEVIVITSIESYHAVWKEHADLMRYFEKVEIPPLDDEGTLALLHDLSKTRYKKIRFDEGVFEEVVRRTNELIQHVPQPEKSIDLLETLVANSTHVSVEDVHRVLSQQTNVPIGALERDEKQILLHLEEELAQEVIGQEQAVHDIASALRRARAGVATKEKPIGTFLFLGPTGSGKTHTGKVLAKHYFGSRDSMTRFDMSEFAIESTAPSFIERLAVLVEERPFGLLFLDELEKAHRVIWNTLLQVLDEGRLSTSSGRAVSFKNNIIIATSNAGTALIEQQPHIDKEALEQYLITERIFSPEFINRFDDVVLFHPLSEQDSDAVVRLLLDDLNTRLERERGLTVAITDGLVHSIVQAGYSSEYGGRALRRTVQERVENIVAELILRDQATPGIPIVIDHL